jgi:hypothetical protein
VPSNATCVIFICIFLNSSLNIKDRNWVIFRLLFYLTVTYTFVLLRLNVWESYSGDCGIYCLLRFDAVYSGKRPTFGGTYCLHYQDKLWGPAGNRSIGRSVGGLVGWSVSRSVGWLVDWLQILHHDDKSKFIHVYQTTRRQIPENSNFLTWFKL